MGNPIQITFQPENKSIKVPRGSILREAAIAAGIAIDSPCGGKGTCGKCKVRIVSGINEGVNPLERKALTDQELALGFRLACQVSVQSDLVVELPKSNEQRILTKGIQHASTLAVNVHKQPIQVPAADIQTQLSDWERLHQALGKPAIAASLPLLQVLPNQVRAEAGLVTAVYIGDRLATIESGDTSRHAFGIAVDIGTTTIVGMLVDLNNGKELAVASRLNPQVVFGADVIARINYAGSEAGGLQALQTKVISALNEIIDELSQKTQILTTHIYEMVLVGNTTMQHLFFGLSPVNLAQAPYVPVVHHSIRVCAKELGLNLNPAGECYFLPLIAGFVGADTVGAVLAAQLHESKAIRLLIDIGTNGEIVLGSSQQLISCSTAAGPAFEGAQIRFGMRGTKGAIEGVERTASDLAIKVIDDVPAQGICGSGLIDAIAVFLEAGLVEPTGRILEPEEAKALPLPHALRQRVRPGEHGSELLLVPRDKSGNGQDIVLTQRDVREVQLAKGAIYAGIQVLLQTLGITAADIGEILLAGAFGNYIRKESALAIGLIPPLPVKQIKSIGNAAGAGAKLALLSQAARAKAEALAAQIKYIELSGRADFQTEFMLAMTFPKPSPAKIGFSG